MEQRARHWLIWSTFVLTLTVSLISSAMYAYWHGHWPFPPAFVIDTSPWIEPQLRALGRLEESEWVMFSKVPWYSNKIAENIGDRHQEARAALLVCLHPADKRLCRTILELTADLTPAVLTEEVRQEMVRLVDSPENGSRHAALLALCRLPGDFPEIQLVLRKNLDYLFRQSPGHDFVLLDHAWSRLCSPSDADLIPRILPLLEDPDWRPLALHWLGRIGDARAMPAVRRWVDDSDDKVREEARATMRLLEQGPK